MVLKPSELWPVFFFKFLLRKFKFKLIYSHLFNYNTTTKRKKEEVKTELTIHRIKHNKGGV